MEYAIWFFCFSSFLFASNLAEAVFQHSRRVRNPQLVYIKSSNGPTFSTRNPPYSSYYAGGDFQNWSHPHSHGSDSGGSSYSPSAHDYFPPSSKEYPDRTSSAARHSPSLIHSAPPHSSSLIHSAPPPSSSLIHSAPPHSSSLIHSAPPPPSSELSGFSYESSHSSDYESVSDSSHSSDYDSFRYSSVGSTSFPSSSSTLTSTVPTRVERKASNPPAIEDELQLRSTPRRRRPNLAAMASGALGEHAISGALAEQVARTQDLVPAVSGEAVVATAIEVDDRKFPNLVSAESDVEKPAPIEDVKKNNHQQSDEAPQLESATVDGSPDASRANEDIAPLPNTDHSATVDTNNHGNNDRNGAGVLPDYLSEPIAEVNPDVFIGLYETY